MSLDIYLMDEYCQHCHRGESVFESNFTHNVTGMWKKAEVYDALYMSEGRLAREFIEALRSGVCEMENDFPAYEAMDSPNGWGTAKHALPWLRKVRDAFIAHQNTKIHILK